MSLRHQAPTATFSLLSINNVQPLLAFSLFAARSLSLRLFARLSLPFYNPSIFGTNFLLAIYTDSLRYNTNGAIRFRLRIFRTTCFLCSLRATSPRNGLANSTALSFIFRSFPFLLLPPRSIPFPIGDEISSNGFCILSYHNKIERESRSNFEIRRHC